MSKIIESSAISLGGYSAGTDAGPEYPLGVHGERLHAWMGQPGTESKFAKNIGAVIIGNTMFRCGEGPWGDENPWGPPVYVLTHTPRDPVYRQGEIAFRFVTSGIESALEQARLTAGDKDIPTRAVTHLRYRIRPGSPVTLN